MTRLATCVFRLSFRKSGFSFPESCHASLMPIARRRLKPDG